MASPAMGLNPFRHLRGPEGNLFLLFFIAGFAYLSLGADKPPVQLFDEHYYLDVGRHYKEGSFVDPQWGAQDPRPWNFEHPPLAKYAMGASMQLLGDRPLAWRLPSLLVGALGFYAAFLLGRNLFWSPAAGGVAALFLALDPMYLIHARMAVLEVFPTVLLTFSFAFLLDRNRPRLGLAGVFLGLAVATKYTALFAGPVILLVAFFRLAGRSNKEKARQLAQNLVLVPGLVVLATYLPYLWIWTQSGGPFFAIKELAWVQSQMLVYGYGAQLTHAYQSGPLEWFLLTTPIYYYYVNPPDHTIGWIYTFGNPFTWWTAIVASLVAFVDHPRRVRLVGLHPVGLALVAVLFVGSLLPYFFIGRILLNFYATQYTPLLAVGAAGVFHLLWTGPPGRKVLAIAFVAAAFIVGMLYRPLAVAEIMDEGHVQWLFDLLPWTQRLPVEGAWGPP